MAQVEEVKQVKDRVVAVIPGGMEAAGQQEADPTLAFQQAVNTLMNPHVFL